MTFLALLDAVREADGAFVEQRKSRGTLERPLMSEASFEREHSFQKKPFMLESVFKTSITLVIIFRYYGLLIKKKNTEVECVAFIASRMVAGTSTAKKSSRFAAINIAWHPQCGKAG